MTSNVSLKKKSLDNRSPVPTGVRVDQDRQTGTPTPLYSSHIRSGSDTEGSTEVRGPQKNPTDGPLLTSVTECVRGFESIQRSGPFSEGSTRVRRD